MTQLNQNTTNLQSILDAVNALPEDGTQYVWDKYTSSLPDGYTLVEYIESSGTQYIDTGFTPNQDTRVVIDVETTQATTAALFGARQGNTTATFCFFNISATSVRSDYGTVQDTLAVSSILNRVIIDKNKNVCTYGGREITQTASTFNCECSLLLLTNNYQGSPTGESLTSAKVYSCQIYDNGTLVRDFVPCTNESGEAGLYDCENNVFYANAGTGTFTVGVQTEAEVKGEYLGQVKSADINAYPYRGVQDGYYYIAVGETIDITENGSYDVRPYASANVNLQFAPVLLWTNASPTSGFASQTVGVDGSSYEAYLVEIVSETTALNQLGYGYIRKTSDITAKTTNQGVAVISSGGGMYTRWINTVTDTSITFGPTGQAGGNYESIPTRIWGVKFTL